VRRSATRLDVQLIGDEEHDTHDVGSGAGDTPEVNLYCLPYAGGSANVFLAWRRHFHTSINMVPVELSGHGRRLCAPLHERFGEVLEDLTSEITRGRPPTDYALLGHSFGGLLAFELAHALPARGHRAPRHLFVSASCAPQRVAEMATSLAETISRADGNRGLLSALAYLGGTPLEILDDDEAVDLFAPILRADLQALIDYRYVSRPALTCDISVILGVDDMVATARDATLWHTLTAGHASTHLIDGDHFAAFDHPEHLASCVNASRERPPSGGRDAVDGGSPHDVDSAPSRPRRSERRSGAHGRA
jgi:surfactin synthase thioesterase subunit